MSDDQTVILSDPDGLRYSSSEVAYDFSLAPTRMVFVLDDGVEVELLPVHLEAVKRAVSFSESDSILLLEVEHMLGFLLRNYTTP